MAETVHVNGECHLRTGTGSSGALESLGYTVDGARIQFRRHTADVNADTGGGEGGVPVDVQSMGKDALITAQLVVYDEAVLAKLRKMADETAEGALETVGTLLGANSTVGGGANHFVYRLLLSSPSEGLPWNFPSAYLADSHEVRLGTKRTQWDLTFRAFAYIGGGTSKDKVLYDRTPT